LAKGSPFRLYPTDAGAGVEIRARYDSRAEAVAAAIQIGALRALVFTAGLAKGDGAPRPTLN
jgi:hypothetical protein